jgi:hypothetical protein
MNTWRLIRKYGRYHRPIAPPVLFWLNGHGGKSHSDAQTKRLVNTSLPPDVELGAGWDACIASLGRPAAQNGIKALMERGFHKPGDVENRLGYYLGQIAR